MYFAGGYDAYAAAYDRRKAKGCPHLSQVARERNFMAQRSMALSPSIGFIQLVMGGIAHEGQSEDQESKKEINMMNEESMDHNHVAVANEFGSCLDVDDGSKICAGGKIVVPGDVVKDVYDKSIAEMKMNVSKHAEAWGTTSFEDPEFWGTITSFKDPDGARTTTNFKDAETWGSASSKVE